MKYTTIETTKFLIEFYAVSPEESFNTNVEVSVTLKKDGFTLSVIVGTPDNLKYLMKKEKSNYYGPGLPWIVVKKVTEEIVQEAVEAYMEDIPDNYWLKLYYFATDIDISVLNDLQARLTYKRKKFELISNLEEQIGKLNNLSDADKADLIDFLDQLAEI